MTSRTHLQIVLALCFAARTAVAIDEPRLTPAEVVRASDAAARQQGYDLKTYTRGEPAYDPVSKTWGVNYRLRSFKPDSTGGGVMSVDVSDTTGFVSTRFWLASPSLSTPTREPFSIEVDTPFHLALLVVGMLGTIVLGATPLVSRRYTYARWAQIALVIACVTGLAWGTLGLMLSHWHLPISQHLFGALQSTKSFSAGICAGIIIAVLLARPWQKRQKPSVHQPQ